MGVTLVRFANGATLTVKPTSFSKDQVLASVGFGGGRLGLPDGLARAYWLVNGIVPAFVEGGAGKLAARDIERLLGEHATKLQFVIQDREFELVSQTQPADLDFDLQLAGAYLVDPGFRPEAVARFQAALASMLPQVDAKASNVMEREKDIALHGGNRRWMTIPQLADAEGTKPEDLQALLQPELRRGPPNVVIVGDVAVDRAIDSVAKTLGALPDILAAAPELVEAVVFPAAGSPVELRHQGRADEAAALVAWPTQGFFNSPGDARALVVANEVIKQRLIDQLREADGATYSPIGEVEASETIPGYGYLAIGVEIAPEKIDLFQRRLTSIVADLHARPISADELERAKDSAHPNPPARIAAEHFSGRRAESHSA